MHGIDENTMDHTRSNICKLLEVVLGENGNITPLMNLENALIDNNDSLDKEFLERYMVITRNEELAVMKAKLTKKRLVLEYLTIQIFLSYKTGKPFVSESHEDFANITNKIMSCGKLIYTSIMFCILQCFVFCCNIIENKVRNNIINRTEISYFCK